jgi:hypothetical protein
MRFQSPGVLAECSRETQFAITREGIAMLFVTLHGGKPERNPHKNNVHAYDKEGKRITSCVLDDSDGVVLNELRGIYLVGKYLYVANANKTQNSLLCYEGSGTKYRFVSRFASNLSCNGIVHPFDFAFDGMGHCFLSSQDTNVVTRFIVSDDGKTGRAAPVAATLPASGKFHAGTFVASSNGNLCPPTTPVATPAGLAYSDVEAKKHSVRGVAWANGRLYVADQPACTVKMYDITGKYQGESNTLEAGCPVHLVVHSGSLYVSGGDHVFTAMLPGSPETFVLKAISSVKVKNSGGMAFGNSGNFYVASRTEKTILKFDSEFKPMKFHCDLPDDPEFLLHI